MFGVGSAGRLLHSVLVTHSCRPPPAHPCCRGPAQLAHPLPPPPRDSSLLQAPFCIHPKTGKVCVPINPSAAWEFDPDASVPTLEALLQQLREAKAAAAAAQQEQVRSSSGSDAGATMRSSCCTSSTHASLDARTALSTACCHAMPGPQQTMAVSNQRDCCQPPSHTGLASWRHVPTPQATELWEATAMAEHIRFFETSFLAPLQKEQRGALAAKAREVQEAGQAGDLSW